MQRNDRSYKDLKQKQKSAIADKTYKMHLKFYLENQRMPDATEMNDICKSLFTAVQSLAPKTEYEEFYKIVESKVLMYLFEDAAKTRRPSVFVGNANTNRFSKLCQEFEEKGIEIFAKIGTKEFSTVYDAFCTRKTTP